MAGRSPARFLAPLALVAFAVALYVVVSSTRDDLTTSGAKRANQQAEATPTPKGGGSKPAAKKRKAPSSYTVKAGDTPSGIAEEVDVPLEQLLELNPDLDPQTLTPGTKLKLRE